MTFAGSVPLRGAAPAAAVAGAGERIGAGSEPDAATTEPRFAGAVAVVADGADEPETTSAVAPPALDDPADEVTTVLEEIEAEIAPLVTVLPALVSAVAERVTTSVLSELAVDCTAPAAGAVISAPAASPALESARLALLIDTELAGGADPVAVGVTAGVGDDDGAGAGVGGDPGAGAVDEAELDVSAGAELAVDDELTVCAGASVADAAWSAETELEGVLEVVACGAGLLTVATGAAWGAAGADAAAVADEVESVAADEVESVAADVWSVGAAGVALGSGAGAWAAAVDGEAGAAAVAVGLGAGAGAGADGGGGLDGGGVDGVGGADPGLLAGAAAGALAVTAGVAEGVAAVAAAGALSG